MKWMGCLEVGVLQKIAQVRWSTMVSRHSLFRHNSNVARQCLSDQSLNLLEDNGGRRYTAHSPQWPITGRGRAPLAEGHATLLISQS